jgi:hypothetical protein
MYAMTVPARWCVQASIFWLQNTADVLTLMFAPSQKYEWDQQKVDSNVLTALDPKSYIEVGPQDRSNPAF